VADISQELLEAVKETAKDNRLSCTAARKLAQELNVPVKLIGQAADQLNIKIAACELGCF